MSQRKTIAIDYDGTYSADPVLWNRFIADAVDQGHRVICVTSSKPENMPKEIDAGNALIYVFCTSGVAKQWYMQTIWRVKVDIWIDNDPATICNGV